MMDLMIVILLMAIAIGPMISSFFPSFAAMADQHRRAVMTAGAQGTLNRLTGLSYATLYPHMGYPTSLAAVLGGPATAQETVSFNGQTYVPEVSITDASSGIGGLIKISVTLDTIVFKTLKADF
ncbi:hypothetical protein [Desulfobacula sp.]|uniref:hypothetical protein n=1 Tax=Desulfobacula sp. TaxID=2593537 RepID=UPI00262B9D97|nr:hypothetical protein [Desulfobacula sp.]